MYVRKYSVYAQNAWYAHIHTHTYTHTYACARTHASMHTHTGAPCTRARTYVHILATTPSLLSVSGALQKRQRLPIPGAYVHAIPTATTTTTTHRYTHVQTHSHKHERTHTRSNALATLWSPNYLLSPAFLSSSTHTQAHTDT
jgi:hypothetical protein